MTNVRLTMTKRLTRAEESAVYARLREHGLTNREIATRAQVTLRRVRDLIGSENPRSRKA